MSFPSGFQTHHENKKLECALTPRKRLHKITMKCALTKRRDLGPSMRLSENEKTAATSSPEMFSLCCVPPVPSIPQTSFQYPESYGSTKNACFYVKLIKPAKQLQKYLTHPFFFLENRVLLFKIPSLGTPSILPCSQTSISDTSNKPLIQLHSQL